MLRDMCGLRHWWSFIWWLSFCEVRDDTSMNKGLFVAGGCEGKAVWLETEVVEMGEDACKG